MKRDLIVAKYLDFLSGADKAPLWVYKFTDATDVSKEHFYQYFEDIAGLERALWNQQLALTLQTLQGDPEYLNYTAREKLLAFYYTLFEVLNENQYVLRLVLNRSKLPGILPRCLKDFKKRFCDQVQHIIQEAINSGEIESRPLISDYYIHLIWAQCLFLLRIWKNDRSHNQATTDEAVERVVNLVMDLLAHNSIDAMAGFSKFIYRNKESLY